MLKLLSVKVNQIPLLLTCILNLKKSVSGIYKASKCAAPLHVSSPLTEHCYLANSIYLPHASTLS